VAAARSTRRKKGRPLREWVPGALRRGYDRRHEKDIDYSAMATEAYRVSIMFADAMKQPATRGARSWP
jgi:hypothetical protein